MNTDNVAKARAALENIARQAQERHAAEIAAQEAAREEAQRQADLAAAQQRTSELLANLRDNLAAQTGDPNSTSTSAGLDFMAANEALAKAASLDPGLDFMDGTEAQAKAAPAHTDTSVVDARGPIGSLPPGLPRLEEVENSPGRQAWLRGMDAVVNRDWELAAAWFGTAQLRDPTNEAIGRAVALSQWTRDQQRVGPPGSVPRPATEPTEADRELMRPEMDEMFREMVASLSPEERARLVARDRAGPVVAQPTEADRALMEPEMRAMFAEMFAALTPAERAPLAPGAAPAEVMNAARQAYAEVLAQQAILRVQNRDFRGAEELLTAADRQAPEISNYKATRDLVRRWAEDAERGNPGTPQYNGLAPGSVNP